MAGVVGFGLRMRRSKPRALPLGDTPMKDAHILQHLLRMSTCFLGVSIGLTLKGSLLGASHDQSCCLVWSGVDFVRIFDFPIVLMCLIVMGHGGSKS